ASAARRVLDRDPVVASAALATVESTARTAIDELGGLLGVLRSSDSSRSDPSRTDPSRSELAAPDLGSTPGLDQIARLVAESRATGLAGTCPVYGDPRPVPAAIALTAYRVVQEALTNTVKHAAARTVDVRIRYLEQSLEVEVNDDGRGGSVVLGGTGLGLIG